MKPKRAHEKIGVGLLGRAKLRRGRGKSRVKGSGISRASSGHDVLLGDGSRPRWTKSKADGGLARQATPKAEALKPHRARLLVDGLLPGRTMSHIDALSPGRTTPNKGIGKPGRAKL